MYVYKFDKTTLYLLFALLFFCGVISGMAITAFVVSTRTEKFLCVDGVLFIHKTNDVFENTGKQCLRRNDEKG